MARKKTIRPFTILGNPILHPLNIILIINVLVFFVQLNADLKMTFLFALTPELFFQGKYWQVFTYGFLHATNSFFFLHIIMNMYIMYMIGSELISIIGKKHFVLVYFLSQLGGGVMILTYALISSMIGSPENFTRAWITPTLGASGAVFGLLVIYGLFFPEREFIIFPIFIVKAKNLVLISIFIGLILEYFNIMPISNMGHLGGAVFGYLYHKFFIRPHTTTIQIPKAMTEILNELIQESKKLADKEEYEKANSFTNQIDKNKKIHIDVNAIVNTEQKEEYLKPLQVSNANICPPSDFNPADDFCLRCEWFANCSLRKIKSE